ncbi:CHASE2 domain-containing protein [Scytonema sp. NUACC26]|uniref:CHASE2 domain-containing protein n=1 Tax=Scytonema sp. NUACC26 TaxID=3140176 RepID=UPI0034DB9CDA
MSKLVVLNLGKGDLKKGFPTVIVQLWEDLDRVPMQFTGALPAAPELIELYRSWQLLYNLLYESLYHRLGWPRSIDIDKDIEIDEEDVTNVSTVEFSNLCDGLQKRINLWLQSKLFRNIEQKLRTKLASDDEIRVIIETESDLVRRLPWHLWDFFEDYQNAVLCLSVPEFERVQLLSEHPKPPVRILAVLGNSEGIDVNQDRAMLEKIPGAKTVFLVEPQRQELDRWLWHKEGWDILFFAGHSSSQSDGEIGRIYINKRDSLTIPQLKNALKAAIVRGLKLAIFNSCDGLGIAQQLASLHIPQMIVMREPVADRVAQEFLKHFLEAYAFGEPFYLAVREAQGRLQGLENEFPCASWLPVICQNPTATPFIWPQVQESRDRTLLPIRQSVSLVLKVSLLITLLIIGMRELGIFQSWELLAFDALMRQRPQEKPDPRILLVTITEADVQSQPASERLGASISDRSLAQLVAKLEQFKPRAIGLDIYRENPVKPKYADLAKTMRTSSNFIAICKVGEENRNLGIAPPPEVVAKERLGFSDVVLDPDGILRRQLLAMAPLGLCNTDKSLSFQLAARYLAYEGIRPKLTPEKNWQFGGVTFQNLKENSGGYRGIDRLGHQAMLNWRATPSVATQVTLNDVLSHKVTPDLVENRVVLIGTTAESFHDYLSTPYTAGRWPHEPMAGVVTQAHMVSQILSAVLDNRPLVWFLPKWGEIVWIWSWSGISGIIACRLRSPLYVGIAGIIGVGILNGVCLTFLIKGGWMPLVPSALALLATGAGVTTYTELRSKRL